LTFTMFAGDEEKEKEKDEEESRDRYRERRAAFTTPTTSASTSASASVKRRTFDQTFTYSPKGVSSRKTPKLRKSPLKQFLDSPATKQIAKFQQIAQENSRKNLGMTLWHIYHLAIIINLHNADKYLVPVTRL
jgi:hypothetical protein